MTTPSISVDTLSPLPYSIAWSWIPGTFTYANPIGKKSYEFRPESRSVPFDNGFRACADWNHSGGKWEKGSGTVWVGDPSGNNVLYSGCIDQGPFPVPVAASTNLQNKGLTKALLKLKNQDLHLGVFLAEANQVFNMVRRAANSIYRSVERFKRRWPILWEQIKARQVTFNKSRRKCDLPSKWLAVQYGWTPLLMDIFGAIKHLKKKPRRPIVTVSSRVEDKGLSETSHSFYGGGHVFRSWESKWVVHTYLHYGLVDDPLAELSSLGLINPAEILWEKIPYSFVVDWFLPVGNWLSALTADVGYSFITGGQSRKVTMIPFGEPRIHSLPPSSLRFNPGKITGKAEHFERHPYLSAPVPGLYVKNPLSALHVANAIALLAVAFRDRKVKDWTGS